MLALLLAATLGTAAPALPPAGKYWYAETVGGSRVNVAAIELRRAGTSIQLNEEIKPETQDPLAPFIQTRTSVNPATMDLLAFHEAAAVGCGEMEYTMSISGAHALVGKKAVAFPGVEHFVVDGSQAFPFLLPSQMQYWHEARVGIVDPVKAIGQAANADPATEVPARPASVPPNDRYLSLRPDETGGAPIGIWYDPATLIVDELARGNAVWVRLAQPPGDAGSF